MPPTQRPPDNHADHGHATRDCFSLENRFDAAFIAQLALREKQVQQSYRPMIGIHKWFARRPGTLFRGLLLSEYGDGNLASTYWRPHDIRGVVADPFMGGGTTIYEALRLGLDVAGRDVNPMAYWLVRQGVEPVDLASLRRTAEDVWQELVGEVGDLYTTTCTGCGESADVKYFLWVKTCDCPSCGEAVSLFPGYRLADAVRHPREVFHCPECSRLQELSKDGDRTCPTCATDLATGNTRRGVATCLRCRHEFNFASRLGQPPAHRLIGIEYRCATCYPTSPGRQFKTPAAEDLQRVQDGVYRLTAVQASLDLPADEIPRGDETDRLRRWGYKRYRDMFSSRQLLGLGLLQRRIEGVQDPVIRRALATIFSDFLRYQNLLCRYDPYSLKCQDIFSVHGFPVGLIVCENNLPGIPQVGSGSFIHFVAKYIRAKEYAQRPYETRHDGGRKRLVAMEGETAEGRLASALPSRRGRVARLTCGPSQEAWVAPDSLDGVFTDPPYFDNVQYAELMDFCYVWLRTMVDEDDPSFEQASTRTDDELTGNVTLARGILDFAAGLSEAFTRAAVGLRAGSPFVFTYHHNSADAYMPIVLAILDAALTVTAVLPAPGEMTASMHIAGTRSSVLDSVFVCRDRDFVLGRPDAPRPSVDVEASVRDDVETMAKAGYVCREGDLLCLRAGHLAAQATRRLGPHWDRTAPLEVRVERVRAVMTLLLEETSDNNSPVAIALA